jgi:hypothetical protein
VKTQTLFVSVFALLLLQACSSSTTEPFFDNCAGTDFVQGGAVVSVVDSASGVPLGNAVTAIAIDGQYFAAVTTPDLPTYGPNPIYLVSDRAGNYDVYVSKAGYKPWVAYNVVVKSGPCRSVQPTEITAKLQLPSFSN